MKAIHHIDGNPYNNRPDNLRVVSLASGGMTAQQRAVLPDLVALAMVGFSLLKADKSASEWSHPAIAAFRADVEPVLDARRDAAMANAVRKWGQE